MGNGNDRACGAVSEEKQLLFLFSFGSEVPEGALFIWTVPDPLARIGLTFETEEADRAERGRVD